MSCVTLTHFTVCFTGLQGCIDGIPAFSCKTKSLKPFDFSNLSLSPVLRSLSQNMLLMMLMPDELDHNAQKKYFDFAADFELNELFEQGVEGVKVKIFATSLDTPGRADLLGMESCSSYTGCCVCKHCFSPGVGSATKLIFDGYRSFLGLQSAGRRSRVVYRGNTYQYHRACTREPAELRDDEFVRDAVAFARHRQAPYLGHKTLPMISRWPGLSWYRVNTPDFMHGTWSNYVLTRHETHTYNNNTTHQTRRSFVK